jgi:hypothetical protein
LQNWIFDKQDFLNNPAPIPYMKFDNELKKALAQLPAAEKDKLILRLLKHDPDLANQLYFKLVSTETPEEARKDIVRSMDLILAYATRRFYSPGYLLMDVREISGMITEHVRITKDKFGEVSLNLKLMVGVLRENNANIIKSSREGAHTFCAWAINKAFKILVSINKMDEDYYIEFKKDLVLLGNLISENKLLLDYANANGFDVDWLQQSATPANTDKIYKQKREAGFLK